MPNSTPYPRDDYTPRPKVIAQFLSALVAFLLLKFGIEADGQTSGLISLAVGAVVAYLVPAD